MNCEHRSPRARLLAPAGLVGALGLVLAATPACKKSESEDEAYKPKPELPSWTPTAAKADAAKPAAGPAYLAVKDQGIAIIDDTGSRLAARTEKDVKAMTVTAKGALYFTTLDGVFTLEGTAIEEVASDEALGLTTLETADDVIEDPKGRLWVIGSKGTIAVRDGETWTKTADTATGMELQFQYAELLFDKEGRSWVAADDNLYRQAADAMKWEAVDVSAIAPEDYMRSFEQVDMLDDGTIVTGLSDGLYVFTEGTWKKAALETNHRSVDHLAARGSTVAVMVGFDLHRLGPEGVQVLQAGDDTWKASRVFDLDLDGSGRVWIATDNGPVAVTGKEARQWTPGTLPGVLGRVESIVVVGAGPTTLPGLGEAVKGAVETGLTKNGTPLVGATIEMCEDPKQVFRKTPCEDAVWRWTVKTGDNGRVRFTDVPIGTYGLTFEIGGEWHEYFNPMSPFECCTQMVAGQVLDVGTFEVGK